MLLMRTEMPISQWAFDHGSNQPPGIAIQGTIRRKSIKIFIDFKEMSRCISLVSGPRKLRGCP
jgi:hypothetical protein